MHLSEYSEHDWRYDAKCRGLDTELWYPPRDKAKYKKIYSKKYPNSIGLFYSAMTKRVGLQPMDEEYILMGMAAYGERGFGDMMKMSLITDEWEVNTINISAHKAGISI